MATPRRAPRRERRPNPTVIINNSRQDTDESRSWTSSANARSEVGARGRKSVTLDSPHIPHVPLGSFLASPSTRTPPQSALTLPHHDDHALLGLCCSPIASHTNLRMGYRRGTHERICVRHAYGREGRGGSLPQCEHTHAASHGVRYGVRSCVVMGHEDETLRDRSEGYTGHLRCVAETHIASEQPNQHYVRECVSERGSL